MQQLHNSLLNEPKTLPLISKFNITSIVNQASNNDPDLQPDKEEIIKISLFA